MRLSLLQITELEIVSLTYYDLESLLENKDSPREKTVEGGFRIGISPPSLKEFLDLGLVVFSVGWQFGFKYKDIDAHLATDFVVGFKFPLDEWKKMDEKGCCDVLDCAIHLAIATGRGSIIQATNKSPELLIPSFFIGDTARSYLESDGPWKGIVMGEVETDPNEKKEEQEDAAV